MNQNDKITHYQKMEINTLHNVGYNTAKDEDWLIHKDPREVFNNGSRIFAGPNEVATLIVDGEITQRFKNGCERALTHNKPFIGGLERKLTGCPFGKSQTILLYTNLACRLHTVWKGHTIQYVDKETRTMISINVSANMVLAVDDVAGSDQLIKYIYANNSVKLSELDFSIETLTSEVLSNHITSLLHGFSGNIFTDIENIKPTANRQATEIVKHALFNMGLTVVSFAYDFQISKEDLESVKRPLFNANGIAIETKAECEAAREIAKTIKEIDETVGIDKFRDIAILFGKNKEPIADALKFDATLNATSKAFKKEDK